MAGNLPNYNNDILSVIYQMWAEQQKGKTKNRPSNVVK